MLRTAALFVTSCLLLGVNSLPDTTVQTELAQACIAILASVECQRFVRPVQLHIKRSRAAGNCAQGWFPNRWSPEALLGDKATSPDLATRGFVACHTFRCAHLSSTIFPTAIGLGMLTKACAAFSSPITATSRVAASRSAPSCTPAACATARELSCSFGSRSCA